MLESNSDALVEAHETASAVAHEGSSRRTAALLDDLLMHSLQLRISTKRTLANCGRTVSRLARPVRRSLQGAAAPRRCTARPAAHARRNGSRVGGTPGEGHPVLLCPAGRTIAHPTAARSPGSARCGFGRGAIGCQWR